MSCPTGAKAVRAARKARSGLGAGGHRGVEPEHLDGGGVAHLGERRGELVRGAESTGTENPYPGESYEFTVGTPPQGFVIDSEVFIGAHLLEDDAADVLVVMLNPLRLEVVRRHGA